MAASDVLRRAEEGGYLDRLSDPLLCCLEDDASLIARAAPLVSSLLEPLRLRAGFRPRDPNLWIWKLKGSIGRRRS
jgi:hypothetical protein